MAVSGVTYDVMRAGVIEHGYARSPLETIAYDLQSQFDRGMAIAHLESTVVCHARDTAVTYESVFRSARK